MKQFFKWLIITLSIMLIWLSINILSTKQGWFTTAIAPSQDSSAFMTAAKKYLDEKSKGNAVMLLIENGEITGQHAISNKELVDTDTVFGVSSLGKWVAAVGVMTLVEQGKIDLDEPVSSYITRWQLPTSNFDVNGVNVRRLLSHTAGITDGLGHNGFKSRAEIQPLLDHLNQAKDADEGVSGKVEVGLQPGSQFKYSGGSYNLLQLLVEEVSGMSFETYMSKAVFTPLGMKNTTYRHESAKQLAQYIDENGEVRDYPFYTSLAATGLYSTASDLYRFVQFHMKNQQQNTKYSAVLSNEALKEMRVPHASTMGIDIWGLGVMLFTSNNQDDFIIGHGGQSPSLNATVRLNPSTGNAIILLETGNRSLASDTATQWTLWETGNPDMYMIKNMIPVMLKRVLIGCVLILLVSLIVIWRKRSK